MKSIQHFIDNFFQKSGSYIFLATLVSRAFSFLGSWIALVLIPEKELGLAIYAFSIISFLIPLGGLGAQQSLLRYGSHLTTLEEKIKLYNLTLVKGIKWSGLVIVGAIILSPVFTFKLQGSFFYFILFSFSILSYFLFEILKIKYRITYQNKIFAWMDISCSTLQVIGITIFGALFGVYGYILALTVAPLITYFIYKPEQIIKTITSFNFINREFWSYGFFAGLANVATQLLFGIDIILIGIILNDPELVTHYKYVSLIPFSLLILPNIFITTDFVSITENIKNRKFIKSYIKNFMTLFSIITALIILTVLFFGSYILTIFGEIYSQYYTLFFILIIGIIGIILIRSLFGNLLSAIGKASLNYWIGFISLIFNILFNYFFIPRFGILGAGITSAIIMWFSGFFSMILFYLYYPKYLKDF